MQERNIKLTEEAWGTIEVKRAEAKRSRLRMPLYIWDNALIVQTSENTVNTAMQHLEAKQKILMNINETILM